MLRNSLEKNPDSDIWLDPDPHLDPVRKNKNADPHPWLFIFPHRSPWPDCTLRRPSGRRGRCRRWRWGGWATGRSWSAVACINQPRVIWQLHSVLRSWDILAGAGAKSGSSLDEIEKIPLFQTSNIDNNFKGKLKTKSLRINEYRYLPVPTF